MSHKELERIFRQWCIKQGILNPAAQLPPTAEEAERDIRILEWVLDGEPPSPQVAARLAQLRGLAAGVA